MRRSLLHLCHLASVAAALIGLALPAIAEAAPTYYPSGPQTSVSRDAVLAGGWQVCYIGTYGGTPTQSSITAACGGDHLMLAGGPTNGTTWTLLAAAPRADVLFNTGTGDTTRNANGTEWYYDTTKSMGFAKGGDTVARSSCDYLTPNASMRLCWHVSNGTLATGYRLGATYPQNSPSDANSQRAVLRPTVPPVNTVAPSITGTPATGSSLSAGTGTWASANPITYAYQWQRCASDGTACADVTGETATTYLVRAADEGRTVRVRVTGTNGSATSVVAPSATVAVPAAVPTPDPDPDPDPGLSPNPDPVPAPNPGPLEPESPSTPKARISTGRDDTVDLRAGKLTARCTLTGAKGICSMTVRAQDARERWVVVGTGRGEGSIEVALNARGRDLLHAAGGVLPIRIRGGVAGVRDERTATLVTAHGTATIAGFDTGSAGLPAQGRSVLRRLAGHLREAPASSIRCVGHASGFGPSTDAQLEVLALRRARAVCAHLRKQGVVTEFKLLSRADARHAASNLTSAGRRHNRRVQVLYSR